MIGKVLLLMFAQRAAASCLCPCTDPAARDHPFRRPVAAAFELNRKGREAYRERRWQEARDRYRAALEADPSFLAPRLNIACAFAQEERFAEAAAEAAELARAAFVPWALAIREAADLAPLQARPERRPLEQALGAAGRTWGAGLAEAVLFLARRAPPVLLPASGVLYLGLEQEILAWLPASGTYRQVTAEEGRVLGFVQSPDRRTVVYLRAGRLVREPGRSPRLRALSVRSLDLPSMTLGPEVAIPGDVEELRLTPAPGGRAVHLSVDRSGETSSLLFDGRSLTPVGPLRQPAARAGAPSLRLTGEGVSSPARLVSPGPCRFEARDLRPPGALPAVQIQAPTGRRFSLEAPHGAGLRGLPFP